MDKLLYMKAKYIPRATIKRLAIYIQALETLLNGGVKLISSDPLAKACDVNASQVRKDFAYFGEFGIRGVGYQVEDLILSIRHALGINREWNCVIVGVGNLGKALLNHPDFKLRGFNIVGAFDCDPFKIGEIVQGIEVVCTKRMKELIPDMNGELGIITTPPERAQRATQYLIDAGIRGILNFTPTRLKVTPNVYVEYVDFFHHMYSLAFSITQDKFEYKNNSE